MVMFRSDKYDKDDIMNKINSIHFFKGAFKVKLQIPEYPIKNYILEKKQKTDKDVDIEEVFFL